jgi:hypothetical protein
MKTCYVITYSDEIDDLGVFHNLEVCKTREIAERRVKELEEISREKSKQEIICDNCYCNDYKIDGKTPDCFLEDCGECVNRQDYNFLYFNIEEIEYVGE